MGSRLKIKKLTKEQEARLPDIRDEWLRHGLSTEPANREEAERGVDDAYRIAGLKAPKLKIWLSSPFAGAVAVLQMRDQQKVRDQVGGQVRDQVWGQVRDQVRGQVRDQVGGQVWDQVWDQVGDQVGGPLISGQHEAGSMSFYEAFLEFGIKECERMAGISTVAKSAGWWWAFENAVILTDRPCLLKRDSQNRLHSLDSKAIEYRDGWGFYCIHGVRVPEKIVIQPDQITIQEIRDQSNAEVRRIMIERFGHARYLQESCAKLLNEDQFGKLWRTEIENDEPLVMVEVVNSTPEPDGEFKIYWLRVPADMKSAHDAVAWTFDMKKKDYQPEIET